MGLVVKVVGEKGWGKDRVEIELNEGENIIGRREARLKITDEKVGRRHCLININKQKKEALLIRASQAKTELVDPKGKKTQPPVNGKGIPLLHGHKIILSGNFTIGVEINDDDSVAPTLLEDEDFVPEPEPEPITKKRKRTSEDDSHTPQKKSKVEKEHQNSSEISSPNSISPSKFVSGEGGGGEGRGRVGSGGGEGKVGSGGGGEGRAGSGGGRVGLGSGGAVSRVQEEEDAVWDELSAAKPKEYKILKQIGSGACGEVFLAVVRRKKVALKRVFRSLLSGDAFADFMKEATVLEGLSHPNVVKFISFLKDASGNMCLVFEYIDRGSVYDALRADDITWTPDLKLRVIQHSANGIAYLHSKKLIHRDLKSQNLLITRDFVVKVTDFGLARPLERDQTTAKTMCGTMPWIAPEVLQGGGYKFKADMYSFAMIIYEVLTKIVPYSNKGMNATQIAVAVVKHNKRPEIPPLPQDPQTNLLVEVMKKCWVSDPKIRPSSDDVVGLLETNT